MSYWLKLTGVLLVAFVVAIVAVYLRETSARGRLARIQPGMSAMEVQAVMGRPADKSVDWNKTVPISGPVMGDWNDTWFFADGLYLTVAYKNNRVIGTWIGHPERGWVKPP